MKANVKFDMEEFSDSLQDLIEAKELLDRILTYYDVYSGQFREIPDYEAAYSFKRDDGSYITDTLNRKIRDYKEFDDSE